jgi:hypothetical protein
VNADSTLALRRPRDVGALLGDAFRYYGRHFGTFLAIGAAVVVPVYLIVLGLGLEMLFSEYDETPPISHGVIEFITTYLIMSPLVVAMTTFALLAADQGRLKGPGGPIGEGLESFTPVFLAVLLAAAGITVAMITIVLGIYFLVRWYFVPQAVVVDRRRTSGAIARSGELVQGSWWRVLGVVLLTAIVTLIPAAVIQLPFEIGANAADSSALSLAGNILATGLIAPYAAIVATLLYFDLRARREGVPLEHAIGAPPEERDSAGDGAPPGLDRPEAPLPPERSGQPPEP